MSIKGNITGVIFDMDGCLVDTESVYRLAWKQAFEEYEIIISIEKIQSWLGLGWDIIAKQIDEITNDRELTLKVRQKREAIFFEHLENNRVKLMPGTLEILTYAKSQNLVVGLASSTYQEKGLIILEHFELVNYFDYIVFGDEVPRRKPFGDIYLKAIENSGLKSEELLVFEDSLTGCQAAEAAKLQTVWLPETLPEKLDDITYPDSVCEIVNSLVEGKIVLKAKLENQQ